jgi:diguanylate cyclase (GGDEF)-like protein
MALVAAIISIFGDMASTRADSQKSRQAAVTSSMDIASTLKLAIQHEQDLVVSGAAFFVNSPDATQAQFTRWMTAERAFARYPELYAISEIAIVTPSEVAALFARQTGGPVGTATGGSPLQITPAGYRDFYCLPAVWDVRGNAQAGRAGFDFCQSPYGRLLLHMRDSGQSAVLPYGSGNSVTLGLGLPIYQGGVVPGTTEARQSAFIGWIAEEIDPHVALVSALLAHPHAKVVLRYGAGSSAVSFVAGSAPAGAEATTIGITNGWHVTTSSAVAPAGVIGSTAAGFRLGVGLLISLLLGALIYVLGTSRSRAIHLVNEGTAQLRHQALHDPLTGLSNRALILDRIRQMMARSGREHTRMAALFIDVDDFKDINDTLGHNAGDELLTAVGVRLKAALRDRDTVGRLGGDEFVVLVEGASLDAGAGAVADRILDALAGSFELEVSDDPIVVNVSIGIAEGERSTGEELLQDADIALYEAKANGKHRAVVFSQSMQVALDDRRHLEADLHSAFEHGQFFVRYQPTVDLSTRTSTGVEAHLGWRHPTRGVVAPETFVPVLESSGLMVPVGRWLLEAACQHGSNLQREGRPQSVSVMASASQFERDGFVQDVRAALATTGLDPASLIVTFPETALAPDETTIARLKCLKAEGVRIALGEFESGYSSLTYLQRYPIDILKVDRSLVSEAVDPDEVATITRTLTQLGRVFGVDIIIEDVPSEDEPVPLDEDAGRKPTDTAADADANTDTGLFTAGTR